MSESAAGAYGAMNVIHRTVTAEVGVGSLHAQSLRLVLARTWRPDLVPWPWSWPDLHSDLVFDAVFLKDSHALYTRQGCPADQRPLSLKNRVCTCEYLN